MSTIAQRVENERELSRTVSIHDELVRQRGHQPVWSYDEDVDDLLARAVCETCGQNLAVRIFADGRAWSAGHLRIARECA